MEKLPSKRWENIPFSIGEHLAGNHFVCLSIGEHLAGNHFVCLSVGGAFADGIQQGIVADVAGPAI